MSDRPTKLIRHFITGELIEVPCETEHGTGVVTYVHRDGEVVEGTPEARPSVSAWNDPWQSRSMGVPIHQMDQANAAAAAAGTGAFYTPGANGKHAVCNCPSRSSRNKEMRRKGKADSDAGYGDYAGK